MKKPNLEKVEGILRQAKRLAIAYYKETGKPLGITGEVAEFEAATKLGLQLENARNLGYDATRRSGRKPERVQIKGCRIVGKMKPGYRMSQINLKKPWDSVVLVILNEAFRPTQIYEATRRKIAKKLKRPGSKARNQRGQLAVSQFKNIADWTWR